MPEREWRWDRAMRRAYAASPSSVDRSCCLSSAGSAGACFETRSFERSSAQGEGLAALRKFLVLSSPAAIWRAGQYAPESAGALAQDRALLPNPLLIRFEFPTGEFVAPWPMFSGLDGPADWLRAGFHRRRLG